MMSSQANQSVRQVDQWRAGKMVHEPIGPKFGLLRYQKTWPTFLTCDAIPILLKHGFLQSILLDTNISHLWKKKMMFPATFIGDIWYVSSLKGRSINEYVMEAYSPNTTSCFSSQLTEMKLFQVITAGILWINICEFTSWIAIPKINLSRKTEKKPLSLGIWSLRLIILKKSHEIFSGALRA